MMEYDAVRFTIRCRASGLVASGEAAAFRQAGGRNRTCEGRRVGGAAGGATATETAQSLDFSLSEVGIAHDPSTLARRALAVDSR